MKFRRRSPNCTPWYWPLILSQFIAASCAEKAEFNGESSTGPQQSIDGSPNPEAFPGDPVPGGEDIPQNCTNQHRALRIAIVVDNSGSMSCKPGSVKSSTNDVCGTDPIKENSPHGGIGYTDRQKAIFSAITRTISQDAKARGSNPDFPGSSFGISSFPRDGKTLDGLNNSVFHSGPGAAIPSLLANTRDLSESSDFQDALWNLLAFTHAPDGATPYATALRGAQKILATRNDNDKRSDVVLFITDGLPTDSRPSEVVKVRQELGAKTKVILLSLYQPGKSRDEQNAPAKKSLEDAWNNPSIQWGHKPGNNDGFTDFGSYWQALIGLPAQVADEQVDINGSENLDDAMDRILGAVQKCD